MASKHKFCGNKTELPQYTRPQAVRQSPKETVYKN